MLAVVFTTFDWIFPFYYSVVRKLLLGKCAENGVNEVEWRLPHDPDKCESSSKIKSYYSALNSWWLFHYFKGILFVYSLV